MSWRTKHTCLAHDAVEPSGCVVRVRPKFVTSVVWLGAGTCRVLARRSAGRASASAPCHVARGSQSFRSSARPGSRRVRSTARVRVRGRRRERPRAARPAGAAQRARPPSVAPHLITLLGGAAAGSGLRVGAGSDLGASGGPMGASPVLGQALVMSVSQGVCIPRFASCHIARSLTRWIWGALGRPSSNRQWTQSSGEPPC